MNAVRDAFAWTRARLAQREDSEHKQVLVRIAITSLFCIYLGSHAGLGSGDVALTATWYILFGELLLSLCLLGAILRRPEASHLRRWIGMLADYAAMGGVMHLLGETGSPLYGVYLWVTIGNGLRYGSRYLYIATALGTLSFLAMTRITDYWLANPYLSWGLTVGAAAVPLYFASLLKALTRAIDEARQANAAKSRFLANMSHELRTPLNGILAMAELLSASELGKDQRESADMIHTSAQTLLLLIDEVLDISAIEAGKVRCYEENFDLGELLGRIYRMLSPQAQAKSIELHIDTGIGVPQLLHGDANHLVQILLNLLQNAVKFTPSGSVTLQVREKGRDENGVLLRFSVRDTGIGIPVEARERIFKPFEQVDSGRDRRYGGSGLGTTIAKSLTDMMGGQIGIEDNPGGGTHFWVDLTFRHGLGAVEDAQSDLPVDADAVAGKASAPDAHSQQRGAEIGSADRSSKVIVFDDPFLRHRLRVRSMRVLVADDQLANRIVLQRLLEKSGHRVVFAEDGEQVLDLLCDAPPDVAIVDLHMPGVSGLDVIRQARVMQVGQAVRTPIIVLSADATVESVREAERAGAHLYLTKPIQVQKLLDALAGLASEVVPPAGDATEQAQAARKPIDQAVAGELEVLQELVAINLGETFIRDFVDQCLRDIGRCMTKLQQAAASADYEAMREEAHAMRGVAENLGAIRLVERCRLLMRADDLQLAKQGLPLTRDLDDLVVRTAQDVQAMLPKLFAGAATASDQKPSQDPI